VFAADLVQSAAKRPGIAFESNRLGEATTDGAGDATLGDQSIECGTTERWRPKFSDRAVAVRDDQALTTLDTSEVDAEILAEFRDANGIAHVHQASRYGGWPDSRVLLSYSTTLASKGKAPSGFEPEYAALQAAA
jgi:hypothetical protein